MHHKKINLFARARHIFRQRIKTPLRQLFRPGELIGYEHEMGIFILNQAGEFSRKRNGKPEALNEAVVQNSILYHDGLSHMSETHQYLQTAFMANYEGNLFEFYRQQQYFMLLAFFSYAFRGPGCLRSYVEPLRAASAKLSKIRLLDYGAGIPYGLIYLLRTRPEQIESVTIVDLDLIHAEFTQYIISQLAPHADLVFLKITDSETIPDLSGRSFNLIYGKDIFEHVHDPERLLRTILSRSEPSCIGYFDITDHGERGLQHVHPELATLAKVICELGFKPTGKIRAMSEFVKTAGA